METPKSVKLGGSLSELAKQSLPEVPARYIRTDQEPLSNTTGTSMIDQPVPVIDLQKLLSPEPIIGELELVKLHSACKQWGFFRFRCLVNHGVDNLLVEKMKSEIQEDQKLDWGDMFGMVTLPKQMRNPRLLPNLPLPLRETIEAYSFELSKLNMTLTDLMEKALKMETRAMAELFDGGGQGMRMNYYPPCPQPENLIGLTPHSDAGGLTILLQLNEMMSNEIYRSVEHRETINLSKESLSVAKFHRPKGDTLIGLIVSMITPETPALFRTIGSEISHTRYVCEITTI
ncbi:hypothetical protein C5167_017887 [Papaver somniferum]|uniref:Fe2OG dioxygenase domain-containing protein n=1 Tax=Papaver somniferum TaxID=3469 RepID=A0A4Y7IKP5_PAPSO|nr:hypothetical protein C5167_017887 [Papaver somniferum]